MHIEFKRIILHNFMSFGDADLRFNDDGFIRVSGVNENPLDNAGSNGSGKSSLWEAIVWAITGETIRGTKHIVNIYGTDGCFVDIEFYIDRNRYQIIRSKDHSIRKTNIQILLNGEDVSGKGIRDSEKLLQQYLPDITSSLLGSVIILGQGLPQKFTNNSPSGRKEVLEKLSKSDFMIEDLKRRVSERKIELQTQLRSFEDKILECTSQGNFLEQQILENQNTLDSLDKHDLMVNLNSLKNTHTTIVEEINHLENSYEFDSQEYADLLSRKTNLTTLQSSEEKDLFESHQIRVKPYKEKLNNITAEQSALQKQLFQIRSIKDVCPTCGQKLPDVHKPDTSSLETDIQKYNTDISDISLSIRSLEEDYKEQLSILTDKYYAEQDNLSRAISYLSPRIAEAKKKKQELTVKTNVLLQDISKAELEIAQIDTKIDNCNKIIRENHEKLLLISEDIMYNNKQKDLTKDHLDVINKFDTALKRDFRGYLLSTVISFIEQRAKYYSSIIFDTKNISFCLDGNNIDISYMNRPYENLSGGEKQKIDLIIQFSIRDMLSKQLGFTSNILVLDEIFDGLDSLGCSKVVDMIASVSDIKNIFIVTHRKDLSIPCDKDLLVVKSSAGISGLK